MNVQDKFISKEHLGYIDRHYKGIRERSARIAQLMWPLDWQDYSHSGKEGNGKTITDKHDAAIKGKNGCFRFSLMFVNLPGFFNLFF